MNTMPHQVQKKIPEGYLEDQAGRLVPIDMISEIDLTRDELVHEIVNKARELQAKMREFKLALLGDINAFVELSAERYDVQLGGVKVTSPWLRLMVATKSSGPSATAWSLMSAYRLLKS